MTFQEMLARMLDEAIRDDIERLGLVTDDLRKRYYFWSGMGNAKPAHFRWDYHPDHWFGIWTPEPWS